MTRWPRSSVWPDPASGDQKAMLRLLAQREEGYEDIGALMGLSVGEVRARVRDALAELERSAEAPTACSGPQRPHRLRREPEPAQRSDRAASTRPASAKSLLQNKRLLAQVGGCVAIVILLILFASGVIDVGGSDDGSTRRLGNARRTAVNPTSNSKVPTQAILKGVDGSDAEGRAIFGRLKDQVLLVVAAKGLSPSPQGSSYAISLARSAERTDPDRRDQGRRRRGRSAASFRSRRRRSPCSPAALTKWKSRSSPTTN